jgi:hypothetical protein
MVYEYLYGRGRRKNKANSKPISKSPANGREKEKGEVNSFFTS